MEQETATVSEVPLLKVVDDTDNNVDLFKVTNEPLDDAKDVSSETSEKVSVVSDNSSSVFGRSFNILTQWKEVMEAEEEVRLLELELKRTSGAFKFSESENTRLKNELLYTKEKLKQSGKRHDFEPNVRKLQEQVAEAEERYNLQMKNLQEALQSQESNQLELVNVKESFDRQNVELENSSKRLHEVEEELHVSSTESHKFEELHKQSGSKAESETKRVLVFESLLELAKASAVEVEAHMVILQEEVTGLYVKIAENEKVEEALKSTTDELSNVQEELEASKSQILDLEGRFALKEALFRDLTEELNLMRASESQAVANGIELERKLRSLEEHKKLELEEIVRASIDDGEQVKELVRELETRCIAAEQGKVEVDQLLKLKAREAEREVEEFSEKISELNSTLGDVEEEEKQLTAQVEEYANKVTELVSALRQSIARNSELESELKSTAEKSAGHEGQANLTHLRSVELEDLVQMSHSKVEDAVKRALEVSLLLEVEKYRIRELEEQISILEKKCGDGEEESAKHSRKVSELEAEVELLRLKVADLEVALKAANHKERKLTDSLNVALAENKNSAEQLSAAENLLEVVRKELKEKLESIESDLCAAGLRETEVVEKLKSAEEQLDEFLRLMEHATARRSESEKAHETLQRDSELKVQEAIANYTSRDIEVNSLFEKSKTLEDQLKIHQEQAAETSHRHISVKEEFDKILVKLASSESENIQLKHIINEVEDLLTVKTDEKEATDQTITSQINTITELSDQHSRVSELLLKSEARISDAEEQLQDAIMKLSLRDSEANGLLDKLNVLKAQIREYEEQAHEATAHAENCKYEVERAFLKLSSLESLVEEGRSKSGRYVKESEDLAEENMKLTQELASYDSKLNDVEEKLSAALAGKEEVFELLHSSKQEIEDLTQQFTSEGQKLQTQISSVAEQTKELCNDLQEKLQLSDDKFCKTDSLLSQALANSTELERNLRSLEELQLESGYAVKTATHKNLELEEIVRSSIDDAEQVKALVRELETRCIAAEQGKVEVEKLLNLVELKARDAEREVEQFSDKISELNSILGDVEAEYANKVTELLSELRQSIARNSELELELKSTAETFAEHEGQANVTHLRSLELEDLVQMSHSKVEDAVKRALEVSLLLEAEKYRIHELEEQISILEKKCGDGESAKHSHKISEAGDRAAQTLSENIQLKHKINELEDLLTVKTEEKKATEQTITSHINTITDLSDQHSRVSELLLKSEARISDAEEQMQAAIMKLSLRDSEANGLLDKLNDLKVQIRAYEEQAHEATALAEICKYELEQAFLKLSSSENLIEELASYESKLNDLEAKLSTALAEKEEVVDLLHSSKQEMEDLTQHFTSEGQKLQTQISLVAEEKILVNEAEEQLHDAIMKLSLRDSEANGLLDKLNALKDQIREYEDQAHEAFSLAENSKYELEQAFLKLSSLESLVEEGRCKSGHYVRDNEDLAEENLKLTQKLAPYESKMNDLVAKLSTALSETEEVVELLHSSKKEIEDLTQQFTSDAQKLQTQISLVAEEKDLVSEISKVEFQTAIIQLEEQVMEHISNEFSLKDEIQILKAEISQNELLRKSLENEAESKEVLEKDAALKTSLEDIEAKSKSLSLLEAQVKVLEQKLQLADAKSKEKEIVKSPMEVTSRDFGSISSPKKRKSKTKVEVNSNTSLATSFKFILGVAIVSIIIGIVFGKRY